MHALGRECKGIAPPRAILSSLGAKAPWDDNIALGGAISFALPPEGTQLPIAFTLFNELSGGAICIIILLLHNRIKQKFLLRFKKNCKKFVKSKFVK